MYRWAGRGTSAVKRSIRNASQTERESFSHVQTSASLSSDALFWHFSTNSPSFFES